MRHSRIYGVENEALQVNGQWAFSNQLLFTAIHSHNKYFKAFNTYTDDFYQQHEH